jgi:D-amino peptidase
MKVYISADMEGATGVVHPSHVTAAHPEYERVRRIWMDDINAIVTGALEAGAGEVLVNDAHALMANLLPEALDHRAGYILGYLKPGNQMQGLDSTFDAAILMAHSRAGTVSGVLSHTYVLREVHDIRLNGLPAGEMTFNIAWAGLHGVPVVLVIGDAATAAEAAELVEGIHTVVTKVGLDPAAAQFPPVEEVRRRLREGAKSAVADRGHMRPWSPDSPFVLEMELSHPSMAHLVSFVPGVERTGARTVTFRHDDFTAIWRVRIVATNLARLVSEQLFGR